MTLSTVDLSAYLGGPASEILSNPPFNAFDFIRSVEEDLPEIIIDYVSDDGGIDIAADEDDAVSRIFVYNEASKKFTPGLSDLPFWLGRDQVIELFGEPSKSGEGLDHPVLGVSGPWDRFSKNGYVIHVRYKVGERGIDRVTLMRPDMVP